MSTSSWATPAIEALARGETFQVRPKGNSMKPRIKSGQLVTLEPADPTTLKKGDVVLVNVRGRIYLHLVKAIDGDRYQIGNNRGHINGWVGVGCIYGKAVKVES